MAKKKIKVLWVCLLSTGLTALSAHANQYGVAAPYVFMTTGQQLDESVFAYDINTVATRLALVMKRDLSEHYHLVGNVDNINKADIVLIGESHAGFDDIAHSLAVANYFSPYDLWLESITGQVTSTDLMRRKISRLYLLLQLEKGLLTYADLDKQSPLALSYIRQFEQHFQSHESLFNWPVFSQARRVAGFENWVMVTDSLLARNTNIGAAVESSLSQGRRALAIAGYGHFFEHYYLAYRERTGLVMALQDFVVAVEAQMQNDQSLYASCGWTLALFKQLQSKRIMVLIPKSRFD
jgi:hypothetical protein